MKRQKAAGKPFFLYLPFSMGHFPNLPSKQFAGKSRIGQYGDKLMEGDSPRRPDPRHAEGTRDRRQHARRLRLGQRAARRDRPRDGQSGNARHGQFRPIPRRAGRSHRGLDPNLLLHPLARQGQAGHHLVRDVLDHGFLPDIRPPHRRQDTYRPTDRRRRPDRRAVRQKRDRAPRQPADLHRSRTWWRLRWKQWRMYFTDIHPTGIGPQRQPGMFSASAPMAGYRRSTTSRWTRTRICIGALFGWAAGPALEVVEKYKETLKKYPNPPAPTSQSSEAHSAKDDLFQELERSPNRRLFSSIQGMT